MGLNGIEDSRPIISLIGSRIAEDTKHKVPPGTRDKPAYGNVHILYSVHLELLPSVVKYGNIHIVRSSLMM